jgi:hypothetical protein
MLVFMSNNYLFMANISLIISLFVLVSNVTVYIPYVVYKYFVYNLISFHREKLNLSNNTI